MKNDKYFNHGVHGEIQEFISSPVFPVVRDSDLEF